MKAFVVLIFMLVSAAALAAGAIRDVQVFNPQRNVGYVVGDIFKRRVELEVERPYVLSRASLPVAGMSFAGMELRKVEVKERSLSETTRYRIELTYQVFSRTRTARKITLPAWNLQVTGVGKPLRFQIPVWSLRMSPLAAQGESDIERDMRPYRVPLQVETGYLKPALGGSLLLVLASMLRLIYINADGAWFPGMGGPFSASYRRIGSLEDSPEAVKKAIGSIQHAFNATFGENLFGHDLDRFLSAHPNFSKLRQEIEAFFGLANEMLFGVCEDPPGGNVKSVPMQTLAGLQEFCRACRDCERRVA